MSPEQGHHPKCLAGRYARAGKHGAAVGTRAWRLGCLILAAGRGSYPALAVTAGGTAHEACVPAVAAGPRLPR